jgi:plastocyanin
MRATTTTSARRSGRMAVLALTVVAGFALLPTAPATAAGGPPTAATIYNYGFSPNPLTIPVGATVQWTNTGNVQHTVTADVGPSFDSGQLNSHATFTHTFNQAGTFTYHCANHPSMTGTVQVGAATTTTTMAALTTTTTTAPAPTTTTTAAPAPTTTMAPTTTTTVRATTTTRPAATSTTRATTAPTTTTRPPATAPPKSAGPAPAPVDTAPPNQVANGATTPPARHRSAGPVGLAVGAAALALAGAGWWAIRRRGSVRPGGRAG